MTAGARNVANHDNRMKKLVPWSLMIAGAFWMEAAPDTAPAVSNIGSAEHPKIDSELHQHGLAADHTDGRARLVLNQGEFHDFASQRAPATEQVGTTSAMIDNQLNFPILPPE